MIGNAFRSVAGQCLKTATRFPLAVLCIVVFYIPAHFDLALPYGGRLMFSLLIYCGAFWFVSVRLYSESHGLSAPASDTLSLVVFLSVFYMIMIKPIIDPMGLLLAFPVLFISMFIAPFIRRHVTRNEIIQFHNQFWSHIGRTIPIVIVLYIIGVATLWGLYYFFNVHIGRKDFAAVHRIILFLCFPLMALTGIPKIQK